jgi:hypothetical protein
MARTQHDWSEIAKRVLKAELKKRGVTYRGLAELLTQAGSPDTERNISNKVSRGGFSAAFFFEAMAAIGCHTVHLDHE